MEDLILIFVMEQHSKEVISVMELELQHILNSVTEKNSALLLAETLDLILLMIFKFLLFHLFQVLMIMIPLYQQQFVEMVKSKMMNNVILRDLLVVDYVFQRQAIVAQTEAQFVL